MNESYPTNDNKQDDSLPFIMNHIPEAFQRKAEEELNETDDKKVEGIKEMKNMIESEETLAGIEFHSDLLQLFLRHSKYDVQKALNRLKKYISNQRNHNPFFNTITDEMFEKVKSANIIKYLPRRTPDGCVVMIMKYGNWDSSKVSFTDLNRYAVLMFQQCLRDPMTQINGFACIHDWKNMAFREIMQCTPKALYEVAKAYLECIPARYKEIHVINYPAAVKIVWSVIKPLMSDKLKRRVIFNSDPKDILNYIPPSVMPVENGGYLNEEFYESTISDWLKKALEQQKQSPLGGQCNYY